MFRIIKNVTVSDQRSPFNGKTVDVLFENKIIKAIGQNLLKEDAEYLDGSRKFLSPGWVDCFADYCEPGEESKETIATGLAAAANGGFSDVILAPNTQPAVTNEAVVSLIKNKSENQSVHLHPMGSVSKNLEGKELAEMLDMHHAGAIAFTDGWASVQNEMLLLKSLEYIKAFDGLLVQLPIHQVLSAGGLMNEGKLSVQLGMAGIPSVGESIMVARDLAITEYVGSRIHFSGISTASSVDLIRRAKARGISVSCSVTPYHLLFNEEALEDYNNVFKVNPPLRTEADRLALIEGVKERVIDCIATHHHPQNIESTSVEFEYSGWGMACQETCWPILTTAIPELSNEQWVQLLSVNARNIFHLPELIIDQGAEGEFTLFDFDTQWHYAGKEKKSMAVNNPFIGQTLKGKTTLI